ncbi:hypothetical protein LCGC14_2033640 [marine sediment metagenome]|uniref:Uncharacterized protein n=1 Tax=marine sediment metagenome TaxID=412755 RepID=A0A0F9FGI4_9ZZZZ
MIGKIVWIVEQEPYNSCNKKPVTGVQWENCPWAGIGTLPGIFGAVGDRVRIDAKRLSATTTGKIIAASGVHPFHKYEFTDIKLPGILGTVGDTVEVTVRVIPKEGEETDGN